MWNSRCVEHARAHVENSLPALFARCLSPRNFHSVRSGTGGRGEGEGDDVFRRKSLCQEKFHESALHGGGGGSGGGGGPGFLDRPCNKGDEMH